MTRPDVGRILRFSVVGLTVAAIYLVLFTGLRYVDAPRIPASVFAFAAAVVFQYLAQTSWTFGSRVKSIGNMRRFALMIAFGLLLSTAISGFLGPALGASDFLSALVVVMVLPVTNYLIMSLWVYRAEDESERSLVKEKM